eukprot:comp20615_c0_seq1/m.42002 comp20615_c0_seq1/g.42002  ORF comp20615_c0_seq1/g.42002 comp20615_c0_seq1/m.42002 type:complete len:357 (-) comp20615_c0_seq1:737-1807(-)
MVHEHGAELVEDFRMVPRELLEDLEGLFVLLALDKVRDDELVVLDEIGIEEQLVDAAVGRDEMECGGRIEMVLVVREELLELFEHSRIGSLWVDGGGVERCRGRVSCSARGACSGVASASSGGDSGLAREGVELVEVDFCEPCGDGGELSCVVFAEMLHLVQQIGLEGVALASIDEFERDLFKLALGLCVERGRELKLAVAEEMVCLCGPDAVALGVVLAKVESALELALFEMELPDVSVFVADGDFKEREIGVEPDGLPHQIAGDAEQCADVFLGWGPLKDLVVAEARDGNEAVRVDEQEVELGDADGDWRAARRAVVAWRVWEEGGVCDDGVADVLRAKEELARVDSRACEPCE